MAIEPIVNGESGFSVRQKLNALLAAVNESSGTGYVDGKIADLIDWINESVQDLIDRANQLAEQLTQEQIERVEGAMRAGADARAMRDTIRRLANEALNQTYQDHKHREELRRQLVLEVGNFAAIFDERIIIAINDVQSVAQRTTLLETSSQQFSNRIIEVQRSITTQIDALAESIESMVVGTQTQFDTAAIWHFDETVEGWTGYPSQPVLLPEGFLRPADNGEYVQSPTVPAGATLYRQIRARLRRTGTPLWRGRVWWSNDGVTWSAAPDKVIEEPGWGDDYGLITVDAPGTGTVRAIRLDLATNSAAGRIDIDWAAVGRPAPGASSAEVAGLKRAYVAADEALAEQIGLVAAELTTVDGKATGTAEAVETLKGRVEATEDGLEVTSDALTALSSRVDDKAEAEAVDQLTTKVNALDDGSNVINAQSTRALRSRMRNVALEALAQGLRANSDMRKTVDVFAEASQSLNTKIESADESLRLLSESVTLLRVEIPTLAKASALQALRADVRIAEGNIRAASDAITALQAAIPGLASSSAVDAVWVETSRIDGRVTTESGRITSLTSVVDGKASSTAVNALTTRVGNVESGLSATSDALTALESSMGRFSAQGRFRVTTEATPSGALSRIGLYAAATDGETGTRQAAFFLEAVSGNLSRAVLMADHVAITNGPTSNTRSYPFRVVGGVVYINIAFIEDLTVGRLKIANNSVTVFNTARTSAQVNAGSATPTVQTLVLSKGRSDPMPMWYSVQPQPWSGSGSGIRRWSEVTLNIYRGSTLVDTFSNEFEAGSSSIDRRTSSAFLDDWSGTGSVTYTMRARVEHWVTNVINSSGGPEYVDSRVGYGTVSNRFIGALNAYK